jgi:hypothetical protein
VGINQAFSEYEILQSVRHECVKRHRAAARWFAIGVNGTLPFAPKRRAMVEAWRAKTMSFE